jgi:hypothetical protein
MKHLIKNKNIRLKQLVKSLTFFGLIIIFSLYYNFRDIKKEIKNFINSKGTDEITMYENRFSGLLELLPKLGVVGYISDNIDNPDHDTKAFYLTQYAIAPTIVVREKNRPLVVGNFKDTEVRTEELEKYGLSLSKDFNNGVMLFVRKDNY